MTHGWQSEPTDGPEGGWSSAFGMVAMVAAVALPTTDGCTVVACSCSCTCSCSVA